MAGSKNLLNQSKKGDKKEAGKCEKKSSRSKERRKSKTKSKAKSPLKQNDSLDTSIRSVWTCKVCHIDFNNENDRLIICERCNEPECFPCSHLETESEYETLTRSSRLHYYCVECEQPAILAVQNDNLIEENCKKYFEKFQTEFCAEVKGLKEKVETLESSVSVDNIKKLIKEVMVEEKVTHEKPPPNSNNEPVRKELVSESVQEMKERDRRKVNLLIFNVEESKAESIDDRKAEDTKKVGELLKELGMSNVNFRNPVRLPKSKDKRFANKPKPLRITVDNEANKIEILQKLKNFEETKKVKLKGIYMKKDLTPMERNLLRNRKERDNQNPPPEAEDQTKM